MWKSAPRLTKSAVPHPTRCLGFVGQALEVELRGVGALGILCEQLDLGKGVAGVSSRHLSTVLPAQLGRGNADVSSPLTDRSARARVGGVERRHVVGGCAHGSRDSRGTAHRVA